MLQKIKLKFARLCGSSAAQRQEDTDRSPSGEATRMCGRCGASSNSSLSAFVCPSCRAVNRLNPPGNLRGQTVPEEEKDSDPVILRRMGSGVFQVVNSQPVQLIGSAVPLISNCSVCLEGAGDCVVQPCAHGGICEACARHIAGNAAVGGAHCPKCRKEIETVLRLARMPSESSAIAVKIDLEPIDKTKAPPRVPPPPGHKKKQSVQ